MLTLRREICVDVRRQFIRELAVAVVFGALCFVAAVGLVWLGQLALGAAAQGG